MKKYFSIFTPIGISIATIIILGMVQAYMVGDLFKGFWIGRLIFLLFVIWAFLYQAFTYLVIEQDRLMYIAGFFSKKIQIKIGSLKAVELLHGGSFFKPSYLKLVKSDPEESILLPHLFYRNKTTERLLSDLRKINPEI